MIVSPAEPAKLRQLGKVASLPEKMGCDFLFPVKGGFAGAQRKEVKDLRASVEDGRLGRELLQAKTASVDPMLLVLEGRVSWTIDGRIAERWGSEWTRSRWYGVLWRLHYEGWWLVQTESLGETARALEVYEAWVRKEEHGTFAQRGAAPSIWGANQTNRDWCVWMAQGLPGVGPKMAEKLVDRFGGVPFAWKREVTVESLCEVEGIGEKTAVKLLRLLSEGEK